MPGLRNKPHAKVRTIQRKRASLGAHPMGSDFGNHGAAWLAWLAWLCIRSIHNLKQTYNKINRSGTHRPLDPWNQRRSVKILKYPGTKVRQRRRFTNRWHELWPLAASGARDIDDWTNIGYAYESLVRGETNVVLAEFGERNATREDGTPPSRTFVL